MAAQRSPASTPLEERNASSWLVVTRRLQTEAALATTGENAVLWRRDHSLKYSSRGSFRTLIFMKCFFFKSQILWNLRSHSFLKILVRKGGCWDPRAGSSACGWWWASRLKAQCWVTGPMRAGSRRIELNLRAEEQFLHTLNLRWDSTRGGFED